MILVIDNYDSFTYNLVHMVAGRGQETRVFRNDQIDLAGIRDLNPAGVLISPGPGRPEDAGVSQDVVRVLGPEMPVLGVCLGHQAIGQVFGGTVTYAPSLMHGKTSRILHDGSGVFSGVEQDFEATRYHSLVVDRDTMPDVLRITAWTADRVVMGIRHHALPIEGIQFHPESFMTRVGSQLIDNWLSEVEGKVPA